MRTNRHITWPDRVCFGFIITYCWDAALTMNFLPWDPNPKGPHALCDVDGNSLKLSIMKTGMHIKIRAKKVTNVGYEYLYTADGSYGMYFAIYYIIT